MKRTLLFQGQRLLYNKSLVKGLLIYFFMSYLVAHGFSLLALKAPAATYSLTSMIFGAEHIWSSITWLVHYTNVIPAILMIGLIRSDFQWNMMRQNIINGFSRKDICIGYGVMVLFFSLISVGLVILLVAIFSSGGGIYLSMDEILVLLSKFGLHCLVIYSFAYFIGFFVRSTVFGILTLFLWYLMIEPILGLIIDHYSTFEVSHLLPFELASRLVPSPFSMQETLWHQASIQPWIIFCGIGFYLVLFSFVPYCYFKNKDL